LPDGFAVKIRHHVNIVSWISVQVSLGINLLQFFRLLIQPVPDEGGDHASQWRKDVLLKIYKRDQPELRITVILARNVIADRLRLRLVLPRYDGNNRDVAVRGGELVPVYIGKAQRIIISDPHLDGLKGGACRPCDKEKILSDARNRA
jgi:hypothetical protein